MSLAFSLSRACVVMGSSSGIPQCFLLAEMASTRGDSMISAPFSLCSSVLLQLQELTVRERPEVIQGSSRSSRPLTPMLKQWATKELQGSRRQERWAREEEASQQNQQRKRKEVEKVWEKCYRAV